MKFKHVNSRFIHFETIKTAVFLITIHLFDFVHGIVNDITEMNFVEEVTEIDVIHVKDSIISMLIGS